MLTGRASPTGRVNQPAGLLNKLVRVGRREVATKKKQPTKTCDAVILQVLVYEFEFHAPAEAEGKIRRRLRYHGLGPYQQERIDMLRRLKNEVQTEIHRWERSRYFVGRHGEYATMEDFDGERLTQELSASYTDVTRDEIAAFVPAAIYLYHLR
jgi:hypothetical protein